MLFRAIWEEKRLVDCLCNSTLSAIKFENILNYLDDSLGPSRCKAKIRLAIEYYRWQQ